MVAMLVLDNGHVLVRLNASSKAKLNSLLTSWEYQGAGHEAKMDQAQAKRRECLHYCCSRNISLVMLIEAYSMCSEFDSLEVALDSVDQVLGFT